MSLVAYYISFALKWSRFWSDGYPLVAIDTSMPRGLYILVKPLNSLTYSDDIVHLLKLGMGYFRQLP